ncbi:glutamate synthase large subunit [Sporolactobacillus spathodeae]|uniref:Glutamate synthase (NADPH/NADH) large chain n=1 Tax=Sporolactobacillus spathodeae TaxID=1465502 RepID=A0ABS2Q470_9BACL|nr:glutamate synthase large subunit [Sporolactobacillus spathodeae]MBM7656583.1 glutamate synthase (NADPH/NADH) large chain [Sporolactobacillus spathodeae]
MDNKNYAEGLYRPEFEHDACGIGLYADIKGRASNDVVKTALKMLARLDHRAGKAADGKTGDGAGILVQVPDQFFQAVCPFSLPEFGHYGVGMFFLPQDRASRLVAIGKIKACIAARNLRLYGERDVPVDENEISRLARRKAPYMYQMFIGTAAQDSGRKLDIELYLLRKAIETKLKNEIYVASLSSQTLVYKGMLRAKEVSAFYTDLQDERFVSSVALVHSRYSTNTFPSWERAHPNRMIVHNGEINTIRGNVNSFTAKAKQLSDGRMPQIIDTDGSDSAIFDNVLEFLTFNGFSLPHAVMMMVPEPWEANAELPDYLCDFYQFHSRLMEPWDGPMALGFCNGKQIGAILDRNGLRPARYYITNDDKVVFSSEVGVADLDPSNIRERCHLKPGQLLLIDTEKGRIVPSDELKKEICTAAPYRELLEKSVIPLQVGSEDVKKEIADDRRLFQQKVQGFTYEDETKLIQPMAETGKEPTGSMGNDTPLAVLSNKSQLLFDYFKQWFSQVTNPPIDAIRESGVMSEITWLGSQVSLLNPTEHITQQIRLPHPVLNRSVFKALHEQTELKLATIDTLFPAAQGKKGLAKAVDQLVNQADQLIHEGAVLVVLSDRKVDKTHLPIPSLLAISALHHHLIEQGTRTKVSLIVDSGEPRDSHQMAALLGYGADAVHPYLAIETVNELVKKGYIKLSVSDAVSNYIKALVAGIVKIMSKVGISSIQSYRGAQTFEALGLSDEMVNRYFEGTVSQIGGIGPDELALETIIRHQKAVEELQHGTMQTLDEGSTLQWRKGGEQHKIDPLIVHMLQQAARDNDYKRYKEYTKLVDNAPFSTIRSLLTFERDRDPIPLDEVESVETILKRFKTGAMSYGSISKEAHEAMAIAMNRIGGKSNSGEGGEDKDRFVRDANGDWRRSAIKQVASARFGVTSYYLSEAAELQIKMAQGAKPGEGGQLPAGKVYPWIANTRRATTGVALISPPPHHDIYSIEDLAQLIYDLKSSNPKARISVKLVAKGGVGTIAAGVAKGKADVILISGHDGGTGAASKTSIKHAGLPWELGLAEAHQTLMKNGLRDRVHLETDGKLMTGRDVLVAACLGAEEYGFATAPLVVLGCLMMRACHLDSCPVGIATQNPELRKNFTGKADYIVNFMRFIAMDLREQLANLGYRSLNEVVGQAHLLRIKKEVNNHWKARFLDLSDLLYQAESDVSKRHFARPQEHHIEKRFDERNLIDNCLPTIESKQPIHLSFKLRNSDRTVGTILGYVISKSTAGRGLPEDTINLSFTGSAGQSFASFIPKGVTMKLTGDANDYVGKGLSGGKVIIKSEKVDGVSVDSQAMMGNVALFGATSGEAYVRGTAGGRFCVRNSGASAVVEGVGENGCEYMTGGRVLVLGTVGRNFAAGMSGGVAYILPDGTPDLTYKRINKELVHIDTVHSESEQDIVKQMLENHVRYTDSPRAKKALLNWEETVQRLIKVIPRDYEAMLEQIEAYKAEGIDKDQAEEKAFYLKKAGKLSSKHTTYQPV